MARDNNEHCWLTPAVDAAFEKAAAKVIERAKRAGTPVVIWQDGHIEEIPSDKLLPNVWANSLAIEHRAWLRKFDPQYLENWQNLLADNQEAALTEAGVRRMLQRQGAAVEPNESLTGSGRQPDFRCTVGEKHFYVEASCVQITTAERKTGVKDMAIGTFPYNPMGMLEAIDAKCNEKASQFKDLDGPGLLAINTFHWHAAMDFSEKLLINAVLTGRPLIAWDNDRSGQQIGETYNMTKLQSAPFWRPDSAESATSVRRPISGLLLCRIGAEAPTALGALNPKPVRPFDPAILPDIPFVRVELDDASGQLKVRWPEGCE